MVKYTPNPRKIIEALVWAAEKCPGKGFHFILKTLFYADKYHLQKYGRPVLGDTYVKMSFGPVASMAYDLLKQNDFLPEQLFREVSEALGVVRGTLPEVKAKRPPKTDLFSGTDIEALSAALEQCRNLDFNNLTDITHQERAWVEAALNNEMDYELFIDEDVDNREELINYLRESSTHLAV